MTNLKTFISIMLLANVLSGYSQSTVWQVSADNAKKANPLEINPKNMAIGKNLYFRYCKACHGEKADGNGRMKSPDLKAQEFQKQSDGAIFFKITTGKDKMPSFKTKLKEEEIWSVINYLRVLVNPSAVPSAVDVKIALSANEESKSLTATVYNADSTKSPIQDADVHFYIKRNFGLLRIGELSNNTGKDGKITITFPEKIIGDSIGNIVVIAKIENNFLYNDAEVSLIQKWGLVPKTWDEEFNRRELWGSRDKSPLWLIFLANIIIIAVWGVIIFVIYNIFRIKKASKVFIK